MELLDKKYKEILLYLEEPAEYHYAGNKQICYLTFPAEEIQAVKKKTQSWISLAQYHGFECETLSLAKTLNEYFRNNPRRDKWFGFDKPDDQIAIEDLFIDLGDNVRNNKILENAILEKQKLLKSKAKPLLIITDLETIHPFSRFGPVEQNIFPQLDIPIIILYPGTMSGSSLEFLGFYPPDGNYRSKHF